jgi:hypothetical protein
MQKALMSLKSQVVPEHLMLNTKRYVPVFKNLCRRSGKLMRPLVHNVISIFARLPHLLGKAAQ